MDYNERQIFSHVCAAQKVSSIIDSAFSLAAVLGDEKTIASYIKKQFSLHDLISDNQKCIVAFNENTALPHYEGDNNKHLEENTLILIDCWAKLREKNSVYADITKLGFYGKKIPSEIQKVFSVVRDARDSTITLMKKAVKKDSVVKASQVDETARNLVTKKGYQKNFIHSTGHSLGVRHVHGSIKLGKKVDKRIVHNMAYAIEPGIYIKGKFGMRSEIDVLLKGNSLVRTTPLQKEILLLNY